MQLPEVAIKMDSAADKINKAKTRAQYQQCKLKIHAQLEYVLKQNKIYMFS